MAVIDPLIDDLLASSGSSGDRDERSGFRLSSTASGIRIDR